MVEIKIILKKIDYCIPYDYYKRMHGYIVKLLGDDCYGTMTNRYIYSNLIGGKNTKNGIEFKNNPYFIIRINDYDNEIKQLFLNNLPNCVKLFNGLEVEGISINNVDISKNTTYYTLKQSPILVQKKFNTSRYLLRDELDEVERYIMENIREKAITSNFNIDENLQIKITKQHNNKIINYNGVFNNGRVFEFKINANDDTKRFILMNGIGRSCGCGFGFIY